jgi:hypothetical protein
MDKIKAWLTEATKLLLGQLGSMVFTATGFQMFNVSIQATIHRSGEIEIEIRGDGVGPAEAKPPCKHEEKKPCKHEEKTGWKDPMPKVKKDKPCPHSKETKDVAPKASSALNDALNKLAEDVDKKNKKE